MRTAHDWYGILVRCEVKPKVAAEWSSVFADVIQERSFNLGDLEMDDFLGQVLHESAGLTRFTENLNYSAERLCQVWPSRFPTIADARPYANNPEALANRVYGGRMGNTESGDGWRYRGRGPIQLTGKDNYAAVSELIGQDLVVLPELMEQPRYSLEATIAWWEDRIPDHMIGDPLKVTKRVNGALIGLNDREHLASLAQGAFA
ncbi:MAG: glycoside hydrolase family 19 protein [Rhodoferax sp.]|uniref:glycoside hydrolase family 19 protein n=1 Tax=Rhodoferax sp. TaxID=50421 RepID=UPI002ACDE16E|nr:glycoside hydrolase family 19 protein [Rhodoferax sp.]MDZ7892337.1 glycoside hydrolase family 19 protein [Rhodoferax sp.]